MRRPLNIGLNGGYFLGLFLDDEPYEAVPLKTKIKIRTLKRVQQHIAGREHKRIHCMCSTGIRRLSKLQKKVEHVHIPKYETCALNNSS